MIPIEWIKQAQKRIAGYIETTPLTYDETHDMYLKWENQQVTGSFKARGALNKVLALERWEQDQGLVAASAGNHGQGVALAGKLVNASATIFVPENAPPVKIKAIKELGAKVSLVEGGYENAEKQAIKYAEASNGTWISPYNDGLVIAGQGTIGLEVIDQIQEDKNRLNKATWLLPTSGGGLLAGISAAVKGHFAISKVVGVQTDTSPFMHAIFYKGTQENVIEHPTIADGLSGPVEDESITIPIINELVDEIWLVTENQVAGAVEFAWYEYDQKIEPSAAVVLAAVLGGKITNFPVIAIISGGNIDSELFDKIIRDVD
jgi:threonine dehydratase